LKRFFTLLLDSKKERKGENNAAEIADANTFQNFGRPFIIAACEGIGEESQSEA